MNNETFLIENSDLDFAKDVCKYIENPSLRERAVANSIGANIAKKYFEDLDVDVESGIHNVAQVLEDLEIADIYINNSRLDVRLYFDENEMCVPKSHFDNDILPLAYMFIQINEGLTGGTVTGFVTPSQIDTDNCVAGYYKVSEHDLTSFYDIEPLLVHEEDVDLPENFNVQIFKYLDGKLDNKSSFYQTLVQSKEARERLIRAAKAQNIFKFISVAKPVTKEANTTSNIGESLLDEFSDNGGELELNTEENTMLEEFENSDSLDEQLLSDDNLVDLSGEIGSLDEIEPLEQGEITNVEQETAEIHSDIQDMDSPELIIEENDTTPSTTIDDTLRAESETVITPLEIIEEDEIVTPIEDYVPDEINNEEESPSNVVEDEPITESASAEENFTENKNTGEVQYSTSTTPSINNIEEISENDDLESMLDASDEISEVTTQNNTEASPQIDQLFGQEQADDEELPAFTPKKQKSSLLPVLGVITLIAAAGYFGYNKYIQQQGMPAESIPETANVVTQPKKSPKKVADAMPVETVENVEIQKTEEGESVSIPAIEQNLDASILVSNLSVSWEVPNGYVSNNTAKRYFTKLGKIIQLNLKTELLLLSKPPITNRISVELEYNKTTHRFEIKGITASSGEKLVDDVITKTVTNALDMNLNTNMSLFGNIQGNPVLMIRL